MGIRQLNDASRPALGHESVAGFPERAIRGSQHPILLFVSPPSAAWHLMASSSDCPSLRRRSDLELPNYAQPTWTLLALDSPLLSQTAAVDVQGEPEFCLPKSSPAMQRRPDHPFFSHLSGIGAQKESLGTHDWLRLSSLSTALQGNKILAYSAYF